MPVSTKRSSFIRGCGRTTTVFPQRPIALHSIAYFAYFADFAGLAYFAYWPVFEASSASMTLASRLR